MGEGTVFSLSVHISGEGGTPSQVWVGGYPISGLGRGGTPSQVWVGGVPHLRSGGYLMSGGIPHVWGVPHI